MKFSSIHPFPARMAPELARRSLEALSEGAQVLDPMCGSGTVARAAVQAGFRCVGVDIDPLAVLMARVWTTRLEPGRICADAKELAAAARELPASSVEKATDPETARFIGYWFAHRQEAELSRLSSALQRWTAPTRDALAIAMSRIIVSKEMMASLARDTSHSRPHRVARTNDFDVYAGFLRAARLVASRLAPDLIRGCADIRRGDARTLEGVADDSVDLVMTSPPYLNAIDYLRGHRLALVWLGYEIAPLRKIRSVSVGAERGLPREAVPHDVSPFVNEPEGSAMASRYRGWVLRYAADMEAVLRQVRRVVKVGGRLVMVIGNSFIRGAAVDNAGIVRSLAQNAGFELESRRSRQIPARRRYLPPPGDGRGALDARMRTETVLAFRY